ncbi:MAG: hypothetical protein ACRD3O_24505 [Terriglobia bacterium]
MWDKLRKQVALEREQLHRLLEAYRPLVERCAASPPTPIEASALGAMLHSFYNGIENMFKRIAEKLDGGAPGGEFWHRELLDSMSVPGETRSAVISEQLAESLDDYLTFRHLFRHAYTFNLRWDRMKTLVLGCEDTLTQLESELDRFLEAGDPDGER